MTDARLNYELFDEWLQEQSEERRPMLLALREIIVTSGYGFKEGIKWGSPSYWMPEISRRNICYLAPQNAYVRLGFFNGAMLDDPDGMLEGTGKKLRHIKVYEVTDANRDALKSYVQRATELAISDPSSLSR